MPDDRMHLSDTALAGLWAIVHAKRRAGSTSVKVPAEWLEQALKDHHTLITALQARKLLQVTVGTDFASLSTT